MNNYWIFINIKKLLLHLKSGQRIGVIPFKESYHLKICKESACNAGDPGSILGSGRSPGKENGYPLQYSCLEMPKDRGVCQAIVRGVAKSGT